MAVTVIVHPLLIMSEIDASLLQNHGTHYAGTNVALSPPVFIRYYRPSHAPLCVDRDRGSRGGFPFSPTQSKVANRRLLPRVRVPVTPERYRERSVWTGRLNKRRLLLFTATIPLCFLFHHFFFPH